MAAPARDLVGQTFGRLTVIGRVANDGDGRARFLCRCSCDGQLEVRSRSLVSGDTTSCGCRRDEVSAAQMRTVATRHGRSRTAEHQCWLNAKSRCFNPNDPKYDDYGGRGITMCAEWRDSFEAFFRDMGQRPSGLSLDRRNNDGNYEPGNCRWATVTEQLTNQRPRKRKSKGL